MNSQKVCVAEASRDRNNNINIIGFFAALMVIYSHAFTLIRNGVDIREK